MKLAHHAWMFTVCLLALCFALVAPARAQSQSFTYQGELSVDGVPANGTYDFLVTPFNVPSGGVAIASAACAEDVPVVNGRFALLLPFNVQAASPQVYLAISVRDGAAGSCPSALGMTALTPRQLLTPAPLAAYAQAVAQTAPLVKGALRFDDALNQLQVSDGVNWFVVADLESAPVVPYPNSASFVSAGSSSFVVPAGISRVLCVVVGSTGAGGARGPGTTTVGSACVAGSTFASAGSGGGTGSAGAYLLDVTPGETLTVIVGAGGVPAAGADGGDGQQTLVKRGATNVIVANGGEGGLRPPVSIAMRSYSDNFCVGRSGNIGAVGGAAGSSVLFLGSGSMVATVGGNAGNPGMGPTCYNQAFPPASGACAASSTSATPPTTILNIPGVGTITGNSGGGSNFASGAGSSGSPGLVRFYWY